MSFLGKILYVTILILNAIVVLSEDRFLARGAFISELVAGPSPKFIVSFPPSLNHDDLNSATGGREEVNLTPATHNRSFGGPGGVDSSVKYNAIQLIASIRTLMRIPLIVINTLIIVYELVLG